MEWLFGLDHRKVQLRLRQEPRTGSFTENRPIWWQH